MQKLPESHRLEIETLIDRCRTKNISTSMTDEHAEYTVVCGITYNLQRFMTTDSNGQMWNKKGST